MAKFRKLPVVIEAVLVSVVLLDAKGRWNDLPSWIIHAYEHGSIVFASDHVLIHTLEGTHRGEHGDWIIKGVKGELYPCKPGIFDITYERVEEGRE